MARVEREFGVRELGRRAGVSPGEISKLEKGDRPSVGVPTIVNLCNALDVRIEWLVFGHGLMDEARPVSSHVRNLGLKQQ